MRRVVLTPAEIDPAVLDQPFNNEFNSLLETRVDGRLDAVDNLIHKLYAADRWDLSRKLTDRELALIQSGAVFVSYAQESKIKRWDGLDWSPSGILGNSLVSDINT
jgi:hypothetical protein